MSGPPPAPELDDFPPLGGGKVDESNRMKEVKNTTWVSKIQSDAVLTEHPLQYGREEGREFIEVPDGVLENTVPLWDDLVEGKFMDTAPHVAKIHVIVNKIWPLGNQSIKIEVYEVDSATVKFRIKDANTRARILRRGMWNIANIPMIVSKWAPVEEEEEVVITTIPMWVTIKNVLRRMFSWKGLGFIASAVGKPKRLHPDTLLCKSFEEAKVFVDADVTKELPAAHRFKSKLGVEADVTFEYPWLPPKCNICSKWGHAGKTCKGKQIRLLEKKDKETAIESTPKEAPEITTEATTALAVIQEVDEEVTNGEGGGEIVEKTAEEKVEERVEIEAEKGVEKESEDAMETGNCQLELSGAEEDETWSNVSPSKQGRSVVKSPQKTSIISSPSRFAVLDEQDDSCNGIQEVEGDREEGEILEGKLRVEESSQESVDKEKTEIGDGINARRVSTRHSKSMAKVTAEVKSQSTSNFANTAGRKRNTKNL